MHVLMKSITCKENTDIATSSKRDGNEAAIMIQINFTELKSKINASQRIKASQSLKKVLVIKCTVSWA